MTFQKKTLYGVIGVALGLSLFAMGCERQSAPPEQAAPQKGEAVSADPPQGPATTGVPVDMSLGWCAGHGVPESVCTRCDSSLIAKFKAAGDWCGGHGLPESQCDICNPGAANRWTTLDPNASPSDDVPTVPAGQATNADTSQGPATTGVPVDMSLGWCGGHGVPESVCTRCNSSLIAKFKAAGDWCGGHGLPESQCDICNPGAAKRWATLDPNAPPPDEPSSATAAAPPNGLQIERAPRLLTGTVNPICQVDTLRVRLIDRSIAAKAGIETDTVTRRRMSAALSIPGEIEFDATRVTRLTPRLGGVVREVAVGAGDYVEAGALLAVIDSPALGEAKSRFIQRTQDLHLAEADLRRTHTINEGVTRLLTLCTPDTPAREVREAVREFPVGEAKAKLLRSHASLLFARGDSARKASLAGKGIGSDRDLEVAQAALAAAEADFIALREETVFDGTRRLLAAQHAAEVARSAFEAARRELHILGLAENQVAAVGTEAHAKLTASELRSPIGGRVVEFHIATGEWVDAADILFVVADTSSMWLVADVYERDLLRVREGMRVAFTVDGLFGVSFEGTLNWVSSKVSARTRTVRVRADLPNHEGLLRAGMFGNARVVLHDGEPVVSVPAGAVQTDGCCQLVFVQESDTVYEPRKLLLGASAGGYVEVLAGLDVGERIATTGSFLLKTEILKSNIGAGCCEVDPGR